MFSKKPLGIAEGLLFRFCVIYTRCILFVNIDGILLKFQCDMVY